MNKETILKKAIEKAEKNGYKYEYQYKPNVLQYNFYYACIIFSHDFAKAFVEYILSNNVLTFHLFGDSDLIQKYSKAGILEEMAKDILLTGIVLEPDPLKYIEKFLEETNRV